MINYFGVRYQQNILMELDLEGVLGRRGERVGKGGRGKKGPG